MTINNMELVMLLAQAHDRGFRAGFAYSDLGGYEEETLERLTDGNYIGDRDNWIRSQVPEGTTAE